MSNYNSFSIKFETIDQPEHIMVVVTVINDGQKVERDYTFESKEVAKEFIREQSHIRTKLFSEKL